LSDLVTGLVVLVVAPVLVIWWLPYLVHELGHAAAAILAGARFDYIPLGPFLAEPIRGSLRIRWRVRRWSCGAILPSRSRARQQIFIASLG